MAPQSDASELRRFKSSILNIFPQLVIVLDWGFHNPDKPDLDPTPDQIQVGNLIRACISGMSQPERAVAVKAESSIRMWDKKDRLHWGILVCRCGEEFLGRLAAEEVRPEIWEAAEQERDFIEARIRLYEAKLKRL
jgi:hypothetical protein